MPYRWVNVLAYGAGSQNGNEGNLKKLKVAHRLNEGYTSGMTKRLVLIDGMSVFYRGYFAMPGLSLPDGTPTGGVYGFASIAIEVINKLEPDYVAVAWDKSKTATAKRKEIFPDYKAGRTR